ncbi:hypothetical protein G5V57_05210 [Nordella sp. HKS 07]|uniref:hypothetical protein n=1 Tax=Nordella sp. HKS 07 TaxID=2712222 RepID=UPI0013E1B5DD|nr:hypothetical protein [Nordella sp. HKS 07]QIG47184.1 hypothetical protein G5V57_05210 [Nordella sp. HKS 07]
MRFADCDAQPAQASLKGDLRWFREVSRPQNDFARRPKECSGSHDQESRWWIAARLVLVAALKAICYPLIVIESAFAHT